MTYISILIFVAFFIFIFTLKSDIKNKLIKYAFNIKSLIVAFVLLGVLFSFVYFIIDAIFLENGFSASFYATKKDEVIFNYFYYSFITQLTIGYGDLYPLHPLLKIVAIIQGILGSIFMGGLVASLIDISKTTLNYIEIKSLAVFHCNPEMNHDREIFNLELDLNKSALSVFSETYIELIAENNDNQRFTILKLTIDDINRNTHFQLDISRKNSFPKFECDNKKLAFRTVSPTDKDLTEHGYIGETKLFHFDKLIIKIEYNYESKRISKEYRIENKDDIAIALCNTGRNKIELLFSES